MTRWYRVVHRACDFNNESIVYVCICVCKNRNPLSSRPIIQRNAVKGVTYYQTLLKERVCIIGIEIDLWCCVFCSRDDDYGQKQGRVVL